MKTMKAICPLCGKEIETENVNGSITPKFESITATFQCDEACGAEFTISARGETARKLIHQKTEDETA